MMRRFPLWGLVPALVSTFVLAACGGGEPEPPAETTAAAAPSTAADEAAIEALREAWVTHYNLHHPDMVAALYTDSAFVLNANQSVDEGRAAIEATHTEAMAGNPTASVTSRDIMVFGDHAVSVGTYRVSVAPEGGEPASWSGHYMNYLQRVDGEWKIAGLITNFDAPPPADYPWAEPIGDPPPEESTLSELIDGYETHWNLQHPDMVADFYTPDAMAAFADREAVEGRAAIAGVLRERAAEMATEIDVHGVGTMDLADGWKIDGGWYEISAAEGGQPVQGGMYMNLVQRMDDGSWKIRWMVSNGRPAGS
jgi:uncharacterized protein (TIGR02246 family)